MSAAAFWAATEPAWRESFLLACHSHVCAARFAAPDPMWGGMDEIPALNPNLADGWPRRDGPLGGPLETFSLVMHLVVALERDARQVFESYERSGALRLARRVSVVELRAMPLPEALAELWPDLKRA